MRNLNVRQQAVGYTFVFVAATALLAAAAWDWVYNARQNQTALVLLLGALALSSLVLLTTTLATRRADDRPTPTLASALLAASEWTYAPAPRPVPSVQMFGRSGAGPSQAQAAPPIASPATAAPAVPAMVVEAFPPLVVEVLAERQDSPDRIPGPTDVPKNRHYGDLEELSYEVGEAGQMAVPAPPSRPVLDRQVENARVLCGSCGTYFRLFMDAWRPLQMECPSCAKNITLAGERRSDTHRWTRCRVCGQYEAVLLSTRLLSYHCASCGQKNEAQIALG